MQSQMLENEVYYYCEVEEADDDDVGDGEDVHEEDEGHENDHDADDEAPGEGDDDDDGEEEDSGELASAEADGDGDGDGDGDNSDKNDENAAEQGAQEILDARVEVRADDDEGSSDLTGEDQDYAVNRERAGAKRKRSHSDDGGKDDD